jgi:hypothetical protein
MSTPASAAADAIRIESQRRARQLHILPEQPTGPALKEHAGAPRRRAWQLG